MGIRNEMYNSITKIKRSKNSLVVQWLGLHVSTVGAQAQTQVQGTKILQTSWHGHKEKEKKKMIQLLTYDCKQY